MKIADIVSTNRVKRYISLLCLFGAFIGNGFAQTINIYIEELSLKEYNQHLLTMALRHANAQHIKINVINKQLSRAQAFSQMDAGLIDVMWLNTNQEIEDRFIPVRVPILKGLMSYRTLMIREGQEAVFKDVETFEQLKAIRSGVGRFWTTTKVFNAEGINTVLTTKSRNLYPMLEGGRFDYIPRGVMEIAPELEKYNHLPLKLETTILLRLPTAVYPFVTKAKPELATIIEQGMLKSIDSGEFDQYFESTTLYKDTLKIISQHKWKVIPINNPILPKETPLDEAKLWVDFSQYLQ
ncbi:hypothetical protein C2869_06460 [Saccharobesus litoralis]|uniref:Solute-binding protein family 3/N-terminal domain-containing protein n=1 Tax=Saccharobesus litoralis TaxID=2172099 RepID=A0A2S0VPH1_9ALTE|nr:hypothetical protein [Saccharobesus litoralis]AWB66104.1 hypothetical protein C2869_06460 [Saccharobesus litoralis]